MAVNECDVNGATTEAIVLMPVFLDLGNRLKAGLGSVFFVTVIKSQSSN